MRHLKHYIIVISILFLGINSSFSQEGQTIETQDFETWNSAQVNLQLKKKLTFGVQGQFRLDNNSSELKKLFTEFTTKYKFNKHFSMGTGLRFTGNNDNEGDVQGYESYFRFDLDATFKHKIKRFDFKYRLKYLTSNEIGVSSLDGDIPVQYFRLKSSIGYNIKNWKLDPEISGEIFSKYVKNGLTNGFDHYRLTVGTSYKTKGYGSIGLYYRLQKEVSDFYPKTTNIVRVKYTYTFKK